MKSRNDILAYGFSSENLETSFLNCLRNETDREAAGVIFDIVNGL